MGTPATEDKKRKQREVKAQKRKKAKKQTNKPCTRLPSQQHSASVPHASGSATEINLHSNSEDHLMGESKSGDGREMVIEIYSDLEGDSESEDDNKPVITRPSKRMKAQKSPTPSDTPEIEITAYVEVVSAPRTLKAKPTSVTHGPFFFTLNYTYFQFLSSIAACAAGAQGMPSVDAIDKTQLSWKLSVPANDRKKPLSTKMAFERY